MPTPSQLAHADQLAAAEADALNRLHAIDGMSDSHTLPLADLWLSAYVGKLNAALANADGWVCAHLGRSPTVMYSAVWMPDTLVCADCTGVLTLTNPERIRCYRCHKRALPINEGVARVGNVLLAFLLCDPCASETGLPTEEEEARP